MRAPAVHRQRRPMQSPDDAPYPRLAWTGQGLGNGRATAGAHARPMRRTLKLAAAAALAVLAAGAPAAYADSIAYVKDGNVWLSTPDGARRFQVTTRGGYSDVSQAD